MTKTRHINSKLKDVEIDQLNPFKNDALQNREQYASLLTKVVNLYGIDGCVMSINGQWGAGKTTFTKMWQQQLKNDGYRTVYFNAWEYDYTDNPLVAIISELKNISHDDEKYKKIASCIGRITLSAILALAKGAIKGWLKIDSNEIIEAGANAIEEFGKKELEEFENQKQTLVEFKSLLGEYVANANNNHVESTSIKPVVFFIDELDRCNPYYAVKTLEIIKHLFDVPNIVFVLSINKEQLSYAIQGYYGSTKMNSIEYLRRFIDIEFNLPEGNLNKYCEYLYEYYVFDEFFNNQERIRSISIRGEKDEFISAASKLCNYKHLSLRTISKIFAQCRLSLEDFSANTILESGVFFYLCFLKVCNAKMYASIRNQQYDYQGLLNAIINDLPDSLISQRESSEHTYTNDARVTNWLIAGLLFLYVYFDGNIKNTVPWKVSKKENGNVTYELTISCCKADKDGIEQALTWYINKQAVRYVGLKPIIDRIELLRMLDFNK